MKKNISLLLIGAMAFSQSITVYGAKPVAGNLVAESNVKNIENGKVERSLDVNLHAYKVIEVPYINQNDIVSGCEAVSATMLLQHYGYNISAKEFTDNFLIKKDWTVEEDNKIHAADPSSAYPGDPYVPRGYNCGFGCYAPVVAKSLNNFLENRKHKAILTTGNKLTNLIENYIEKDIPVLIWATMDMKPSRLGNEWVISCADENSNYKVGDLFTWIAGEHCLVLVGYDEKNYYFNDPYKNHGLIAYDKNTVEERFAELGCQSVILTEKESVSGVSNSQKGSFSQATHEKKSNELGIQSEVTTEKESVSKFLSSAEKDI